MSSWQSKLPAALPVAGKLAHEVGDSLRQALHAPFDIDGASVLYLIGSTMDWVEDDFAAGFVFENPNAKGACGCGESFTV